MPFGLTNDRSIFQILMHHAFKKQLRKYILILLVGILIFSKNMKEHVKHMRVQMDWEINWSSSIFKEGFNFSFSIDITWFFFGFHSGDRCIWFRNWDSTNATRAINCLFKQGHIFSTPNYVCVWQRTASTNNRYDKVGSVIGSQTLHCQHWSERSKIPIRTKIAKWSTTLMDE